MTAAVSASEPGAAPLPVNPERTGMGKRLSTLRSARGNVIKAVAGVAAAAGLAAGAILVSAGSAQAAADPTCNVGFLSYIPVHNLKLYVPGFKYSDGHISRLCVLHPGDKGQAVFSLQQTLNMCYGEKLHLDEQFGPATKAALARAQHKEGISADGTYGPVTRSKLKFTHQNGDFVDTPCYRTS
ncbi:peptidoglycan-binding domain-containing protein [Krasilnikovia sp. MM14-A1004]|uniref:peptidoglycan-binding domain-containing protein n=1 Tax=Krasilnikovia sp. MM14-A1004 TaxID=3373541 RepID=UPI00399CAB20